MVSAHEYRPETSFAREPLPKRLCNLGRLMHALEVRRLDGIVATSPQNVFYLSGFNVSVANSYSRGDREFEKATAMLFPSEIAQRGRMRDHTAAPFRRCVTV